MNRYERKIDKVEYDKMNAMNYGERKDYFINTYGNIAWVCGYGFYGMTMFKRGDEYIVAYELGSTCD